MIKIKCEKAIYKFIESSSNFYMKTLFTNSNINNLNIEIIVEKFYLNKDENGYTTCNIGDKTNFTIYLNERHGMNQIVSTLAHELIHVKQFITNRLKIYLSGKFQVAKWQGLFLGRVDEIPYDKRPWEIEAFDKERSLFNAYLSSFN